MKSLTPRSVHPGLQLVILVGLAILGLSLASALGLAIAVGVFHMSLGEFGALSAQPERYPQGWGMLMLLEGLSLAGLGAGALALPLVLGRRGAAYRAYFSPRPLGATWWLGAAGLLILVLGPALSVVIAWNAGAHFPPWAHAFGEWARAKETQAEVLTRYLTNFTSPGRLLVGLLVIAVVPAVAEELVFRGGVQRNLVRLLGSRHAGVWVAAALFSAVHLEFFGFVPRLLLGAVLGYLYEWSGNILVPMAAHFTQNAAQLLLLYFTQAKLPVPTTLNPDANQALPWPTVLLSAVLTAALLLLLHRQMAARSIPPAEATTT